MTVEKMDSVRIAGFKSIRDAKVPPRGLNVLIGANGSGKSNFIAAFEFLGHMLDGEPQLDGAYGA